MKTIMTFFRFLKTVWQVSNVGILPRPEWLPEDSAALRLFLATPSGVKFQWVMKGYLSTANESAAFSAQPIKCGWAQGYRGALAQIEFLTELHPQSEAHEDEEDAPSAFESQA